MRTVQRTVINMGSQSRRPTRVPLLTARHKALLLSWARQHYHWTVDDWKHGTVQSGGASVIVWDVCSWRDMAPLIRLETNLTGDRYLSILPDHLHSFMPIVHSDGLGQFQQDNATPHASRVATKWLQEQSSNFRLFHWSPKSPEMNIIEDIRDALLHAVENRSPPPRTPMNLWTVLKDEWCELLPRYLQTLVESMPHLVAALLCVHGGPTRY
ncbi:hypothetical protein AVEN_167644-1 [Araneus ventricosus]|uniref:Tc1-like transposase DDE domain-containing protein n=1 Tax=Araneus ventricosus TaxID=182803 RepID=A0A4Y2J6F1_ARAVE|nr:hypothetical protein AVEN_167644-1 [Araneus ventricosus]